MGVTDLAFASSAPPKTQVKTALDLLGNLDSNKLISGVLTMSSCFFITPIGDEFSEVRRKTEGLIEALKPLLYNEFEYSEVLAAHQLSDSGVITNQIIKHILFDEMVIANLTNVNPNVMYELALRHVTGKPIIHIAEKGTKLPFDLSAQRVIFFTNDMLGVKELTMNISKILNSIGGGLIFDNPIYTSCNNLKPYEHLSNEEISMVLSCYPGEIQDRLNNLKKGNGEGIGESVSFIVKGRFPSHDRQYCKTDGDEYNSSGIIEDIKKRLAYFSKKHDVDTTVYVNGYADAQQVYYIEIISDKYIRGNTEEYKKEIYKMFSGLPYISENASFEVEEMLNLFRI